jgi:hypothetical protein
MKEKPETAKQLIRLFIFPALIVGIKFFVFYSFVLAPTIVNPCASNSALTNFSK